MAHAARARTLPSASIGKRSEGGISRVKGRGGSGRTSSGSSKGARMRSAASGGIARLLAVLLLRAEKHVVPVRTQHGGQRNPDLSALGTPSLGRDPRRALA